MQKKILYIKYILQYRISQNSLKHRYHVLLMKVNKILSYYPEVGPIDMNTFTKLKNKNLKSLFMYLLMDTPTKNPHLLSLFFSNIISFYHKDLKKLPYTHEELKKNILLLDFLSSVLINYQDFLSKYNFHKWYAEIKKYKHLLEKRKTLHLYKENLINYVVYTIFIGVLFFLFYIYIYVSNLNKDTFLRLLSN